jgi:broad specificity phosphatase PhoE
MTAAPSDAVATRFVRTRQTVELALQGRDIPLLEPDLDEIRAGGFDGKPISACWAWKDGHGRGERFPHGESLDDAKAFLDSTNPGGFADQRISLTQAPAVSPARTPRSGTARP